MEPFDMRKTFYEKLNNILKYKGDNSKLFSKDKYLKIIAEVKQAKIKHKKEPGDYRRLHRFDVITEGGCDKLIEPLDSEDEHVKYYVSTDELFDILNDTHVSIGHGGRTRMAKELNLKYKNVTNEIISLYLCLCQVCHQRNAKPKRGFLPKPVIVNELNSRCQIDVLDYHATPDGENKYVLSYLDPTTRFVVLKPLKSKRPEEVAYNLLDVFTTFGAPSVLQSNGGREFSNSVVNELGRMWPELKLVHGSPSQGEGRDAAEGGVLVQNMLSSWLVANRTSHWAEGLKFVQLMKNTTYHQAISGTPFEAKLGAKAKLGLPTEHLPCQLVAQIKSEEDLEMAEEDMDVV